MATEQLASRLMSKVHVDPQTGCWNWAGCVHDGYGKLGLFGGSWSAHRVSYEVFVGEIPYGLTIDHLCRNKGCINPEHLEAVTNAENKRREYEARGVCRNGLHPRTPENEYARNDGSRRCAPCARERDRRRRARQKLVVSAGSTDGNRPPDGVNAPCADVQASPLPSIPAAPPPPNDPHGAAQLSLLGWAA